MSSIAKPFINFTDSLNPNTLVPVEQVMTVESVTIPGAPSTGSVTPTYQLLFTMFNPNSTLGGRNITISFATATLRTNALATFLSTASTPIT